MAWILAAIFIPVIIFYGGALIHLFRTNGSALCIGALMSVAIVLFAAIF